MIKVKDLEKKYGETAVLSIPSLEIKKGERLALTGANGSGKSTLLKVVAGVISFSGSVEINGSVLYMPQNNIPFDMTVLANVTFALSGKKKEKEETAYEALKKTGLEKLYKKNAMGLSGGERARLSLARILAKDCDLLLLDEPTGAVDIEGTEIIEKAVKDYLTEKERTLIIATHSPVQAKRMCTRVVMLEKGEITEDSTPEELLKNPRTAFGQKFVDMWRY